MAHVIPQLPDAQIDALMRGYRAEQAARRRTTMLGVGILLLLILLAAGVAEVNIPTLAANIWRFTDYIGRIFFLDNGQLVFTDIGEWFWG
ncbi:MAG: hypothetical protein O9972_43660, partial [Burkholderiales bacterium]|nr:hypothetical protein [Burkholderiales bacterium]